MRLYRIDVNIVGTAYVKAESREEARSKADEHLSQEWIEVGGDELISGARFDDDRLPEVSLSPAMTITGLCDGEPDEVEDDE